MFWLCQIRAELEEDQLSLERARSEFAPFVLREELQLVTSKTLEKGMRRIHFLRVKLCCQEKQRCLMLPSLEQKQLPRQREGKLSGGMLR